jgi:integrase
MRGRPVTAEEFERMLAKVEKVVGRKHAASWRWLLRGLYASGLRVSEARDLQWEDGDGFRVCGLDGLHPMFSIPSEAEKGNRNRLLPIAPEFVLQLRTVPKAERTGYVFNPTLDQMGRPRLCLEVVERKVRQIGIEARVVTGSRKVRNKKTGEIEIRPPPTTDGDHSPLGVP